METAAEADPDTSGGSSNLFEEEVVRVLPRSTTDGVESVARPSQVYQGDQVVVLQQLYVPVDSTAPVGSEPPEDVAQEHGAAMFSNQPTINMEIDLARVQQPSFMSPVVILNSRMVEPVPEVQATIEILEDDSERGDEDEGNSGAAAVSAATTVAMMESPIVLIEDTLRMGGHGQEPQAGPSTSRNLAETPRSREY